ncbi:MAG: UDP-N-acetylmuramoyl-L-alanine--D-glutamate ligase [Clostridia bacterium]|nr:UDP-N-acetylmuramoyl-L-alanine--D-glutamate ligase [Clostridia bacterium]
MDHKQYFEQIKGKRVAFLGVGVSNRPLVYKYLSYGAIVTVRDKASREKLGVTADELEKAGVRLILGDDYLKNIDEDIIFRTPGMRYFTPELVKARQEGRVVTSEMETFFDLCPCKIFAVTGSDGKTTSTTLISLILKEAGKKVHLGGNIGTPLLPIIEDISPDDIAVVELSSFQLISMKKSPSVAVVTNVAPNHLDIHKDMKEYIDAKKNIFLHQSKEGKLILNYDNDITRSFVNEAKGEVLYFSRKRETNAAYCTADKKIYFNGEYIMDASDIKLPGVHNVENYLDAISATYGIANAEHIKKIATTFGGVEHRMELVREKEGVRWYNDSIATNPTRVMAGLNAIDQRIILIAGGYDKQIPFEPMGPAVCRKVKTLILTGATKQKIYDAIVKCPDFNPNTTQIFMEDSLEDCVKRAASVAVSGDIVALSPACASFDYYRNFEERGNHFKDMVNGL